jgi:hypothetical protein
MPYWACCVSRLARWRWLTLLPFVLLLTACFEIPADSETPLAEWTIVNEEMRAAVEEGLLDESVFEELGYE